MYSTQYSELSLDSTANTFFSKSTNNQISIRFLHKESENQIGMIDGLMIDDDDWFMRRNHWRKVNAEEKGKVVAASWETELIPFLAASAIFHHDDLSLRNSSFSLNRPSAK